MNSNDLPPLSDQVEPLLRRNEAARLLAICLRSLDAAIGAGKLRVIRLGNSVRIDPRDLREFLDRAKS